jgi:hypothetical protein
MRGRAGPHPNPLPQAGEGDRRALIPPSGLIEKGLSQVTRYAPDGDKIMRLHAQTATIENGFVWLPREAPWLAEYLRELTLFPAGRHDDQVDSTAQALAWIKSRPRAHGMAEHWRRMAEEGAGGGGWGR